MKRLLKNKINEAAMSHAACAALEPVKPKDSFKAGAAFALDHLWIDKTEQMPETHDSVLVLFNNYPTVGMPELLKEFKEIRYWMPIPKLPYK